MRPLLILTKNLMVEQKLQEKLQHLNYEVFCSVTMLKRLRNQLNRFQMIQSYQAIIFSETLNDQEVRELLTYVTYEDNLTIRKFIREPSREEQDALREMGIDTWIYDGQSLDVIREQLAVQLVQRRKNDHDNVVFLYQREDTPNSLAEFKGNLTKKERLAFNCLLESENGMVSRENMCHYLWKDEPNNSHLTQISVLIKRIKLKLSEAGFQDEMIKTIWGYGYQLSPKLLHFYNQEAVE
ncbi:winged helix-turn-helix domain-containing protein [Enterococcus sp. 669A]|uniref:Winged helix-turn-helix domain-containing protein n=1 Tax=Candidatus Enterococcus moelleringii TaxID=2815325 RepID=A0ABS3LDF6_9ENTE|nr:helix-turn-helix domain-containing protein [Enterococcus sp. 669A]MBO1307125.1 winged helix-turn-helix domain-containing protein [Enterococcus sp. 669A]